MTILSYSGYFGENGKLVTRTTANCICDSCEVLFSTNYGYILRHVGRASFGQFCSKCSRYGVSESESEILSQHPEIVGIKNPVGINRISTTSRVIVICPDCHKERETRLQSIRQSKNGGRCVVCSAIRKWNDPDKRNRMNARKKHGGVMSGLHQEIKSDMLKGGILGFESEVTFQGKRVDEINRDKQLIIEVYGNYWHCNPKFYPSGTILQFPTYKVLVDDIWVQDAERLDSFSRVGYESMFIWEQDYRDAPSKTIASISEWIAISDKRERVPITAC